MSGSRSDPTGVELGLVYRVGSTPFALKMANKYWYPFVTRRILVDDVLFLNYGYEEDPPMALADVPMRLSCERIVNAEVLRGMERNSQRSQELVSRHLPALLRRVGNEFAGVQGSQVYRDLQRENCRTGCIGSPRIEATSTPPSSLPT